MLAAAYINVGRAEDQSREVGMLNRLKSKDDFDVLFKSAIESRFWPIHPAVEKLQDLAIYHYHSGNVDAAIPQSLDGFKLIL